MRYANAATVFRHCFNEDHFNPDSPDNAIVVQELEDIEEGVAALIDKMCNRTFGAEPLIESRVISDYKSRYMAAGIDVWLWPQGDPINWSPWPYVGSTIYSQSYDDVYIIPWGLRDVTVVSINGDWDGAAWDDEVTIDAGDWELLYRTETPEKWAHAIRVLGSGYGTQVRVTGTWQDGAESLSVPPEIREAAAYITADMYRTRELSPAGEIGMNGLASYVRNVWEEPFIKMALKENTFRQLVI